MFRFGLKYFNPALITPLPQLFRSVQFFTIPFCRLARGSNALPCRQFKFKTGQDRGNPQTKMTLINLTTESHPDLINWTIELLSGRSKRNKEMTKIVCARMCFKIICERCKHRINMKLLLGGFLFNHQANTSECLGKWRLSNKSCSVEQEMGKDIRFKRPSPWVSVANMTDWQYD